MHVWQPLVLVLLDLEALMPILRGVVMELNDCSLPLLKGLLHRVFLYCCYTNSDEYRVPAKRVTSDSLWLGSKGRYGSCLGGR